MQTVVRQIEISKTPTTIKIYFLGDIHWATVICDRETFLKTVKEIKEDPNAYWVGMGDYGDYITLGDPRFDIELVDPAVLANRKQFEKFKDIKYIAHWTTQELIKILKPIAEKGLWLHQGNHEETCENKTGYPVMETLCEALNIPYAGYEALSKIRFVLPNGKNIAAIDIYSTHGWGGGRKAGAKIIRIVEMQESYQADVYVAAHTHDLQARRGERMYLTEKGKLKERDTVFMRSGSFRRRRLISGTTYEEKKGYHLQARGPAILIVRIFNNARKLKPIELKALI